MEWWSTGVFGKRRFRGVEGARGRGEMIKDWSVGVVE